MDKEAQKIIADYIQPYIESSGFLDSEERALTQASAILKELKELGYRKITDKPPLLSDEELMAIDSPGRKEGLLEALYDSMGREAISYQIKLAQAQWDICDKWYENK